MNKHSFKKALREISRNAGRVLFDKSLQVYENLTEDERKSMSLGGEQPMRLAKTIMVACADEVERQFNAEAIIPAVRKVKRIRKSRYC